jgi:magnesium-protoporphyrin IX monomethyl ester (oxidative) cyclase
MSHIKLLMPRLAEEQAPYHLFFEVTARLTKEQLQAMAAAGVVWVQPGIESLHSQALQLMNKGTEAWQNIQFLRHCRELGLFVTWMMLYGFPEEKDEWYGEMADLMPLIAHLQPPAFLNPILFMRNSSYFQEQERYGVKLRPFPINRYIWPNNPGVLEDISYLLENEGAASHRGLRDGKYYSPVGWERTNKEVKKWNLSFYSSDQPKMLMHDSRGELEIIDTRPVAVRERHILTGLARWIYLACDTAPTEEELYRCLEDEGVDRQAGETMVAMLQAYKLVVAVDGRLLALAVTAAPPVPDFFTRTAVRDMSAWAKSHQYGTKKVTGQ